MADFALGGKVGGGLELVDGPGVGDFALSVGCGELDFFDDVGELENDGTEEATDKVKGEEAEEDLPGGSGEGEEREDQKESDVEGFEEEEE